MTGDMWDDPAWLKDEVLRQRIRGHDLLTIIEGLSRTLERQTQESLALSRTNLWLNRQLEDIGDWLGENDVDGLLSLFDGLLSLPWQEELRSILQRERPEHIGPPEMVHVSFHWRDRSRPDGYFDALPGDGFGFAEAVEGFGLRMQFDCAGILACSDLSFDALRETLAKEGWTLWPLNRLASDADLNATFKVFETRILELERELKSTEKQNEWLEGKLYGEGDERDNVKIARDRVEQDESDRAKQQEGEQKP